MFKPRGYVGRYIYYAEVNVIGHGNYTVYCPIPLLSSGNTSFLTEKNLRIIYGNGSFNFTETKYGKALAIRSNNSIKVGRIPSRYHRGHSGMVYRLSMSVEEIKKVLEERREYWIYCNYTGSIEKISIEVLSFSDNWIVNEKGERTCSNENPKIVIRGELTKGWQKVRGEFSMAIAD
jgi:hypothetical protein